MKDLDSLNSNSLRAFFYFWERLWDSKSQFGFLVEELLELEHNKELPCSKFTETRARLKFGKSVLLNFDRKIVGSFKSLKKHSVIPNIKCSSLPVDEYLFDLRILTKHPA